MQDPGRWEPSIRQAALLFPVQSEALAAAPQRRKPVPLDLVTECFRR